LEERECTQPLCSFAKKKTTNLKKKLGLSLTMQEGVPGRRGMGGTGRFWSGDGKSRSFLRECEQQGKKTGEKTKSFTPQNTN